MDTLLDFPAIFPTERGCTGESRQTSRTAAALFFKIGWRFDFWVVTRVVGLTRRQAAGFWWRSLYRGRACRRGGWMARSV